VRRLYDLLGGILVHVALGVWIYIDASFKVLREHPFECFRHVFSLFWLVTIPQFLGTEVAEIGCSPILSLADYKVEVAVRGDETRLIITISVAKFVEAWRGRPV